MVIKIKMHTLPVSFALFTYVGYWRPIHWSSNSWKYRAYNVFTIVMVLMLHWFAFCGIIDIFHDTNLHNFIEKFSLLMSVLGVCFKVSNVVFRRDKIISLTNMLLEEKCIPRDQQESIIQRKFDYNARTITIYFELLNESTAFFASVGQYGYFLKTYSLLMNWVPYSLSSLTVYWITLIHQSIVLMITANSSVANETLISGLMIQICAQLEILSHRARTLSTLMRATKQDEPDEVLRRRERKIIAEFIEHHLHIYKFAHQVNSVFMFIFFIQFSISSIVLCMIVYKLSSKSILNVEFLWTSFYLVCMFLQLFLYCWYGNEVTLKSLQVGDALYEMDWTKLRVNVVRDLLVIMLRASKPIRITSGHIVTLSLDSFMNILKVSYSTYNFLQNK